MPPLCVSTEAGLSKKTIMRGQGDGVAVECAGEAMTFEGAKRFFGLNRDRLITEIEVTEETLLVLKRPFKRQNMVHCLEKAEIANSEGWLLLTPGEEVAGTPKR